MSCMKISYYIDIEIINVKQHHSASRFFNFFFWYCNASFNNTILYIRVPPLRDNSDNSDNSDSNDHFNASESKTN